MKLLSLAATVILAAPAAASSLIEPFATCEDLSKYYVDNLLPFVNAYGVLIQGAYINTVVPTYTPDDPNTIGGPAGMWLGAPGGNPPKRVGFSNFTNTDGAEESYAPAPADNGQVAGVDFSTTNNQVEGVDEPDIIKTDGKRVFTLSNSLFSAVEVLDGGKSGQRTGKIKLPTYAFEMLFEGDWVLAIGTAYGYKRPLHQRYQTDPTQNGQATVVYQINVADISNPRLVATLQLEGNYVESREVDGVARMIISFDPLRSMQMFRANEFLGFSTEQTTRWNREIVQYSAPGHWMPTYTLSRNGETQAGTYADCHNAYYSTGAFSGFKMLSVVTLPIDGFLAPQGSASVLSNAEKVYSTTDSLYVTTSEFQRDQDTSSSRWGGEYLTSFHKFDMSNAGANFLASGSVSGSVLNQFSMHEHNGIFFIATTEGASWWFSRDLSKSKVTSYEHNEETRQLVQIGEAGNLGLGERIYAVRYLDDTAYVVTFRQIDPLYIIDLADPKNLKVTGELKIPGFSSYLHYVGKDRILGVGQEATPEGRTVGAKVSLFDVSDKTSPKEVSSWILDRSSTNVQWDHRAFLFWWREGIAVMPVNQYSSESRFVGAVILDVSENEIKERGRVTQKVEGRDYEENIKRNAIVGQTNLWSMSSNYLQVNDVNSLDDVTGQVSIKDD